MAMSPSSRSCIRVNRPKDSVIEKNRIHPSQSLSRIVILPCPKKFRSLGGDDELHTGMDAAAHLECPRLIEFYGYHLAGRLEAVVVDVAARVYHLYVVRDVIMIVEIHDIADLDGGRIDVEAEIGLIDIILGR